ncbi:putative alpha-galactosidase [Medicago truncatula]|uniref:Putative alpha-galactosidase n=1 Tax=Medicago truncatula TaxID=3880 RepID=G7ZWL6_MEDTR|nr:raffinose synthase or seed inhibition protein [Medicago truncatula]RHN70830.1 putative alpha-galactosidase [Medicago truncatula]
MFNSGGAVKEFSSGFKGVANVSMKVCWCGLFGAYSSAWLELINVDSEEVEFSYEEESGSGTIDLIARERVILMEHSYGFIKYIPMEISM